MPFKHFEGLKPTHGDQIGVSVPCEVNLTLDDLTMIMMIQAVDPDNVEQLEGKIFDFLELNHGRVDGLIGLYRWHFDASDSDKFRARRAKIAKLYGWTIED